MADDLPLVWAFAAPFPDIVDTIVVFPPAFGDSDSSLSQVKTKITMSGDVHTNIQRQKRVYNWQFSLDLSKATTFANFFKNYSADTIQVVTHDDTIIIGNFLMNPFLLDLTRRISDCVGKEEAVNFGVDFEATQ